VSYAGLALVFLTLAAAVALTAAVVARPPRRWWGCTAAVAVALLVLTAVFDSLMIAADLFRFDESRLLGVHVLLAPLEDFAWPLASALALPALWEILGRERTEEEARR
jgi:lycopene cyclase domain-containing protein